MSEPKELGGGELAAIERLAKRIGAGPAGEVWIGDDAAVLDIDGRGSLLLAADAVVEGVHFDRRYSSLADIGWKALAANVSDIAAMGGTPLGAVVTILGASGDEIDAIYDGLLQAASCYGCAVVGGDLSSASQLAISVALSGTIGEHKPVLRSGAKAGDLVFLTGALGSAAAGLRALRDGRVPPAAHLAAHQRPQARLSESAAATRAGATAMIDISDGFGLDLSRVLDASEVGVRLETVPVAEGANEDDAMSGGEDFELCFTAPELARVLAIFEQEELRPPLCIGTIVAEQAVRQLGEVPLGRRGYVHRLERP